MIRYLFLVAATLFAISFAAEDVVVGTKDNFDSIIGKDDLTLVKFFAPWCGHCKKMAGDFKEAATELKGKAVLVDLDATQEKDIAAKYGIRGFPTLKLFSKGEVIADYTGGRTKDALVKYIERALLPSITALEDKDAVTKFVSDNADKSIVFGVALDKFKSEYKKISMSLRDVLPDSIVFGSVEDAALLKDVAKDQEVSKDEIVLIRDDKSAVVYSGVPEELESWVKIGSLPLFQELSRDNANLYTSIDKPAFILFQDAKKKDEKLNDVITAISKKHRSAGAVVFTWIDLGELKNFAEHIGVADKDPAIAIYNFATDSKYIFNEEYSEESLGAWVDKFVEGKLTASIKSENIPEKNDEPVKVVVGKSWDDIVMDSEKDVLIEQYAPWCGHCKKLAPILDELASDLKDMKTLVIAKMDATQNDAPADYKAQGFPTMHFFPAGSDKGIEYDGGRDKEDFIKFFHKHATHKDGLPADEEKKESTEDSKDDKEEL